VAPPPLPPPPPPQDDDDIQEVLPVKSEPKEIPPPAPSTSGYDNQALVQQVRTKGTLASTDIYLTKKSEQRENRPTVFVSRTLSLHYRM
jgi:hypothetical protein